MKFRLLLSVLFFVSSSAYAANNKDFSLTSLNIKPNSTISNKHVFNGFGCSGENVSPQLSWSNAPKGTKSFAITVYDPDAPTGSGWWHYVAANIPASYNQLSEGFANIDKFKTTDEIIQVRNDFGIYKFGGPCPPQGSKNHHYIFTIHALGVEKLEIPETSTAALAGFMINHNSLGKTSFTAVYKR